MRILLSPAKKMNVDRDNFPPLRVPVFLPKTLELIAFLKGLSPEELRKLWGCNENLAALNIERLQAMGDTVPLGDLSFLTPAILSYEGLAFQHMAPSVFSAEALDFVQEHLRILSGFYGCLAPFDGVTPYRLEMQAKVGSFGFPEKTLYDFWGSSLYETIQEGNEDRFLFNLASKEYSKCVDAYLSPEDLYLTVIFGEQRPDGKVIQKGTLAKMARGDMVRYLSENALTDPEDIKSYTGLNFQFIPELSTDTGNRREYVFLKQ